MPEASFPKGRGHFQIRGHTKLRQELRKINLIPYLPVGLASEQRPHRQKRNFRRQIKNANPEEIDAFLQYDILPKAAFQPKFLLILLLNAALFTVTILFGSIPLLLVVVISAPLQHKYSTSA